MLILMDAIIVFSHARFVSHCTALMDWHSPRAEVVRISPRDALLPDARSAEHSQQVEEEVVVAAAAAIVTQ